MLDSLVEQTDKMIEEHGVEMETGSEWAVAADWLLFGQNAVMQSKF